MYIVKKIGGQLTEWVWDEASLSLRHHPRHGRGSLGTIQMISVCDSNGKELYQQPWWLESRGEVSIVADEKGRIGFVEIDRHCVIPLSEYFSNWGISPPEPFVLPSGSRHLELPRGFSGAILEEAQEETMLKVTHELTIDNVNSNTSFFATSPSIELYRAEAVSSGYSPMENEQIRRVIFLDPADIAHLRTICGYTKASLWSFIVWATKSDAPRHWRNIAKEIIEGWSMTNKD